MTVNARTSIGQVTGGVGGDGQHVQKGAAQEELHDPEPMVAWDDITGEALDPREVLKARLREPEYIREKGVWSKIKRK